MESRITESTLCADDRPVEVCISILLDPYDWYELKETAAYKEVVRLVENFGSRGNLLRRLEALDLKERATTEQVHTALCRAHPEAFCKSQQTAPVNTEPPHHSIWQKLKKLISG